MICYCQTRLVSSEHKCSKRNSKEYNKRYFQEHKEIIYLKRKSRDNYLEYHREYMRNRGLEPKDNKNDLMYGDLRHLI